MITVIYLIWANKLCGHFQQETELANVSMDRMPRHLHFKAAYNGWEQDQQVWESNIVKLRQGSGKDRQGMALKANLI